MRYRYSEYFLLILLIVSFTSCKKNVNNNPNGPLVYISGYGQHAPFYWKNGVITYLPMKSPAGFAIASSIFVSDSNVYLAGTDYSGNAINAVYWNNGIEYTLTDLPEVIRSFTSSIFVSGTDVYVSGYELTKDSLGTAVYWKNGVPVNLTPVVPPYPTPPTPPVITIGRYLLSGYAMASSIYVSNGDIYVGGYNQFFKAAYWKNGLVTQLADTNLISNVSSMFISGNDIYAAGWLTDSAVYWKNGMVTYLYDGLPSQAFSIFVSGNDVYVSGGEDGVARYWKNGISTLLQSGNTIASSIFVLGDDVYVAGGKNSHPEFWKNGTITNLPVGTSAYPVATSIYVTNP